MKSELNVLLRLSAPMIATQFFIMGMGFVDTAMSGQYSSLDLAGVAMGGVILWPLFMLFAGVLTALTPMVSQHVGGGRRLAVGALIQQGIWVAMIFGVILFLLVRISEPLLILFDVAPEAVSIAMAYLKAASWGCPAVMLYVTLRYACEGLGQTLLPMLIAGTTLPINAGLNYVLIYGLFGAPELGGEGCGWATAITMWFELGVMLLVIRRPWLRNTGLFERVLKPKLATIKSILQVGLPIGMTMFLEMTVFSLVSLLVGSIGIAAIGANTIGGNLNWFVFVIPMALGSAASIRVGYHVGAKDYALAAKVARLSVLISATYAFLASLVLVLGREVLPRIYTSDPAVLALTAEVLLIVAAYQFFDCTQATMIGALRGYKDTQYPMIISIIGYWLIALPVGTILGWGLLGWNLGVLGFWIGLGCGVGFVALFAIVRLYRTSRDVDRIARFSRI
ncbi:MATE family efflux transporter [Pseudomonadales bacterium]|jgi:MATE family multidrug resistance protein|nr:MATE family efflux transporter [Gammaproteobacteria bacterium]MDC0374809.1 MATE family efflux transporter [Pseudomonadales bacterium]MBT5463729.1 MATE family efflux transporter [Gammaproteobacteria bacterium]MBT6792937.1 MATE family efflux transporter [Gammaproteobacteria bacterium]MBT7389418.1 MATE family efflux transporter [Gammaproteobacteria bacterium]